MKYLNNINTLEELKKAYRQWAMKLHPDMGGSGEEMKILNAEYEQLFARVKDTHTNKNGEEYRKESNESSSDFINIINELIRLNNIHIEIIGSFLWVSGETKPYRETLKKLGLKWHSKKECWFLSPDGYRRHGKREYSMGEIREMYGVSYDEEIHHRELQLR